MEEKCYTVYMHICPNSKKYIGITKQNPKKRWINGKGYKTNDYFFRAIQKYSWDNIKHEILFSNLTKEEAEQKEIELIAFYKSNQREYGYNIENGGSHIGNVSEETKKKISIANKGRKISEKTKEKIKRNNAKYWLDKKRSEEVKQKISKGNKGKKRTLEQKLKQSKMFKGKNNPFYNHKMNLTTKNKIIEANSKKVKCIENNKIYNSLTEAAKENNTYSSLISFCCNKKRKTAGKLHWEYIKEE